MSRNKTPVAVLEAKNSKHYSKEALAQRAEAEVAAPCSPEILVPEMLRTASGDSKLEREYMELAPILKDMGVLSDIDGDNLARYLISRSAYRIYTSKVTAALKKGVADEVEKWSKLQDRAFKQCRAAASDVGLTVNARANILLPKAPEALDPAEADMFG